MERTVSWLPGRGSALAALALLVPAPTIGILVALLGPKDATGAATPAAKAVWVLSKLWILLLPALWHRFADGQTLRLPRPRGRGMNAALVSGVLFFVVILLSYATLGRGWIDAETAAARIADAGLDRPWLYLLMAVYWCTVNSLLEEYVWRWFVLTRCEAILPRAPAVAVSGLLFTVHHTLALAVFFGDARVVILASIGIWAGGTTWSWIYLRSRNLWAAWTSHVFADVAVFWIGYRLVFAAG